MDPDGHPIREAFANHLLRTPAQGLLRLADAVSAQPVTEESLLELMDHADEQDVIDESQKKMITNIIELADATAGDIMTHRVDMVAVEQDTPCRAVVPLALESGNSRLPVYRRTVDDVVGILYVKDLLRLLSEPEMGDQPVTTLARPAIYVPESRSAQQLLLDFKRQRTLIAIVVDEWGGTAGLVSMEDILEEIVGEIQDEYDDEEAPLTPCKDGFVAVGDLDLDDLFEAFGLEPPADREEQGYDTVGGLITAMLGRIPEPGEEAAVEYGGVRFAPLETAERRVRKARCTRVLPRQPQETEEKTDQD